MRHISIVHLITIMLKVVVCGLFSACNGLFEDVYDNNKLSETSRVLDEGEFVIDATSYTQWHYFDFETDNLKFITSTIENDTTEIGVPLKWTIAMHRYDVKTNQCTAAETNYTSIDELQEALSVSPSLLSQFEYRADIFTDNKVITDISQMMDSVIFYQKTYYNETISRWLNVDISSMPPTYNMSHKTYILKTPSNNYYAIYLVNYMNEKMIKGYMTVKYKLLTCK